MIHKVSNTEESQLLQKMIIEDAQRELLLETPTDDMAAATGDRNSHFQRVEHLKHVYRITTILTTNKDNYRTINRQNIREALLLARLLSHAHRASVKVGKKGDKEIRRIFQRVPYKTFKILVNHVIKDIFDSLEAANVSLFYANIMRDSLLKVASLCRREQNDLNKPLNSEISSELRMNHDANKALREQMKKELGLI